MYKDIVCARKMQPTTCYVCLEECEEESRCTCRATAHQECLREFGKSKCTICLDKMSVCSSESNSSAQDVSQGSEASRGSGDSMGSAGSAHSHASDIFLLFPLTGDGLHPAKCFAWAFMFIMTAYVCFGINLQATILGGVVFLVFCLFGRFLHCLCKRR